MDDVEITAVPTATLQLWLTELNSNTPPRVLWNHDEVNMAQQAVEHCQYAMRHVAIGIAAVLGEKADWSRSDFSLDENRLVQTKPVEEQS